MERDVRAGARSPRISIVIPFYNGDPAATQRVSFLEECLESVRTQAFQEWEAIVVDDGSPQGELDSSVIRYLGDARIRYLRHPVNKGLGAARNTGFHASRADIILPLDSDDRLHPMYLRKTYEVLRKDEGIDCVFTHLLMFGSADRIFPLKLRPPDEILSRQWIPGPGTLMRRRVWELAEGYSEDLRLLGNEDWDFWIAALIRGARPALITEPLYEYRQWPESMMASYPPVDGHRSRELIYRRHESVFRATGRSRQFLAGGYLNSAIAERRRGRRRASVRFALGGIGFAPLSARLWLELGLCLLPSRFEQLARALLNRIVRSTRGRPSRVVSNRS